MANLNLLVVESSGKQKRRPSNAETVDFLSIKVGASALEIKETASHFDFSAKKLTNVAAGGAAGEVLIYDQRGAANGVASLDGAGKVPVAQLPSAVMTYEGVWNASTNSPSLADGAGDAGMVYRVGTAGSQDLGSGSISFSVGDYVIYNGTIWEKSDTTDAVASVNSLTGVVVLDTDDISEGTTNKYFSSELAQDAIGTILTDSSSIDFTYDDGTPSITAVVLPAGVDHDSLQNFVANEHIDHSSVSINTASLSGLSGGGNITASRSLVIDPSNATLVSAAVGDHILIADASDSAALKKVTVQSIVDLAAGDDGSRSYTNDNGSAITIGQIVYIKTDGDVDLAQATVAAIADAQLGIVKDASIASAADGLIFVKDGSIISGFTGLTIGAKLYVSRATAGAYTQSLAGFVAGEMVYSLGRAISATEIAFDPEFEFEF
jgi:hypothetical protein